MPTINAASDRTSQKRYCLTAGNGSSNCCSGPPGPPGPSGIPTVPGSLWNILYNDGAAGISASPLFTYNIASDNLAFGAGTPGVAKAQLTTHNIALGSGAGATQTNSNNVAIGYNAGYLQIGGSGIAIGLNAGSSQTASSVIAIGDNAGQNQSGSGSIAIGYQSAKNGTEDSIAIGSYAGFESVGIRLIAIGASAGASSPGAGQDSIAIGTYAGFNQQTTCGIALGSNAGYSQGVNADFSIAMGYCAGYFQESRDTIAIGAFAGYNETYSTLSTDAIAIGNHAGYNQTSPGVIAIGGNAGYEQLSENAIAIGAYAGLTQTASSIILNAGGAAGATTDGGITGFFVSPVRSVDISANAAGYYPISYNSDTREVVYNPVGAFKGYVAGVIECNPGPGATSSSVTVTNIATPVTYLAVSQQVGGITFTTGTTGQAGIILPVTGLYEVTSILQCDSSGSPTNITAWHSQNGVVPPTGARTVSVSSAGTSILTTSNMFQTVAPNEYVQLMITTSGAGATAQLTSLTKAYGGITTTDPAVMTTIKLVG